MVEYECKRCKKLFNKKSSYMTHFNRKIKCKIVKQEINDKIIELTEENKKIKIEKEEIEKEKEKIKLENEKTASEKLLLEQSVRDLKEFIDKLLKETCNKSSSTINHIINANTNNIQQTANIQQNNTIKLNPYRKEDLSHITDQEYNRFLSLGYGSVPSFVKKIHFNDDKPENHNILLSRADCNDIYVYNNENEWECKDKNIVIEQIISDKTNILYNKRLDKNDKKSYKFDNYFESFESEDKKKMKDVTESIKRVCLTGKDKVMKTKKLIAKKKLEN
jgi:hypothetical protein